MTSILDVSNKGNYFEIICMEGESDIDIPDTVFFKLLQTAKGKSTTCFQKHYKEYVFRNIHYENNDKNQVKIYKKTPTFVGEIKDGWRMIAFYKEKLPYHAFPATTNLYSISYVSKAIIKITNRVFLNFEKRVYPETGSVSFNKIYVNYNHDDNVDVNGAEQAIRKCLQIFE
jgi:hypothetical protein